MSQQRIGGVWYIFKAHQDYFMVAAGSRKLQLYAGLFICAQFGGIWSDLNVPALLKFGATYKQRTNVTVKSCSILHVS